MFGDLGDMSQLEAEQMIASMKNARNEARLERNEALDALELYYLTHREGRWPDIVAYQRTGKLLEKHGRLSPASGGGE